MRYFQRFTSGVLARVDELCVRVENHESLAGAALLELQTAAARAQARQGRVRKDGEALRQAFAKERDAVGQWRERARRSLTDEARALECLRRSKRAQHKAVELEQRVAEHEKAERDLGKDVDLLQERLSVLREQHNLMRTRQVRAEALASVSGSGDKLGGELAAIFERWETQVAEAEFCGGCRVGTEDTLDEQLSGEEELVALKGELASLGDARGGDHE
jgi:phage shock protein A